jgi:hypothetical protein
MAMYKTIPVSCKVVSMVRPDQSARDIVTYFNEDPLDLSTGLPKNDGWKNYFEFTHTGQGPKYIIPHTWDDAIAQLRQVMALTARSSYLFCIGIDKKRFIKDTDKQQGYFSVPSSSCFIF